MPMLNNTAQFANHAMLGLPSCAKLVAFLRCLLAQRLMPLLPVLALAACATPLATPDSRLSFEIPKAWSITSQSTSPPTSEKALVLTQWWSRFDDPLLTTLVTQALASNISIKSAQASLRQAWALRDVSASALLPSVRGAASVQRSKTGGKSSTNAFQVGFDANWDADVFGHNRHAVDAFDASAQSSAATVGDVQVAIAAEVGLSYISLRSGQMRLAFARENLSSQEQTLEISEWRQQAGQITALEVAQARAAVEQTRALLPTLQTAIALNRHAIAVLTGQTPTALEAFLAASKPVPQAANDFALEIPAETLRQRADVRAAEWQVAAASARVAQADAARLPNFTLGGSIGLNALTLGALGNGTALASSLLASVAMPVFDGGAARAQVRAQQAAFEQVHLAYQATILMALKEVEDALVTLQNDRQRLTNLHNAGAAAATAVQLAQLRYRSGVVDFQVVLDTQRTLLASQDAAASAYADVSSDHIRLYKALGGGWRPLGGRIAESSSGAIGAALQVNQPHAAP